MKIEKRLLLRIFFVGEIIIFSLMYLMGSHGVYVVMQLQQENKIIESGILGLELDIKTMEQEITTWKKNQNFFIEKEAREKLQLAHKDDVIFYT